MPQKLTIKEIAELAGVSKATVSRVINGKPGVNPETRKKVEQVIRTHSYAPNLVARGLSLRQTGNIGLIVAHSAKRLSSHLFFLEFLQGVSRYLTEKGFRLTLTTADSEEDYESSCLNMAQGGFVDGAIILGIRKNDRRLKYFLKWEDRLDILRQIMLILITKAELKWQPSISSDWGIRKSYSSMDHGIMSLPSLAKEATERPLTPTGSLLRTNILCTKISHSRAVTGR